MLFAKIAAVFGVALTVAIAASPAQATTMTQCSAMYQAAQTAGTLNGLKWNDFRKANCSAAAAVAAPVAAVVAPAIVAPKAPTSPKAPTPPKAPVAAAVTSAAVEPNAANTENMAEPAANHAVAPAGVAFPKAVSAQYASETAGKARMHTCLDQYKQDKAANGLSGLTWIQAGGGYYSICNTKLKG